MCEFTKNIDYFPSRARKLKSHAFVHKVSLSLRKLETCKIFSPIVDIKYSIWFCFCMVYPSYNLVNAMLFVGFTDNNRSHVRSWET
jgi:hypothetical protein